MKEKDGIKRIIEKRVNPLVGDIDKNKTKLFENGSKAHREIVLGIKEAFALGQQSIIEKGDRYIFDMGYKKALEDVEKEIDVWRVQLETGFLSIDKRFVNELKQRLEKLRGEEK